MKKKILIMALAVLAITSCGSRKDRKIVGLDGMHFDSLSVDTIVRLSPKTGSPSLKLQLNLTYIKGKNAERINPVLLRSGILSPDYLSLSSERMTVRTAVDSFVNAYSRGYMKDYAAIYKQDPTHPTSLNNVYILHTHVESRADHTLNYFANIHYYGGGIHPLDQTLVRNFDTKTGKLITLNDLFVPGYQKGIEEVIRQALLKKYKVDNWQQLARRYFFASGKIYAPDNFIVGDKEITFIYCEDEIAPHSEGEIRLTIKKSKLKHWLR
ncbi:MAG: RsiV family protein [Prevotella sp.]|jgi:hypothetical protein|nr:RsiV family protein [Prevotella sp.]MCH3970895.1 RsiV family protein [Prevotella sp.]MCH3993334.1 RsiV family protein [Prevotella sp.]MCH4017817.1 RsiV family protein [Prevotella sp.]MCH4100992.1 RsiV family protein [Prevotella sp.]MCH4186850.1 RsiV family protein [Prevotella sp.]